MDGTYVGIIVVPSIAALLLFGVFTYLHSQSRETYFRAWQLGWAAYCLYFALVAWNVWGHKTPMTWWLAKACLVITGLAIFVSTRLVKNTLHFHWYDAALATAGMFWAGLSVRTANGGTPWVELGPLREVEAGVGLLLLYCAWRFLIMGRQRASTGFGLLSVSLGLWGLLMLSRPFHGMLEQVMGTVGHFLGPLPQMLIGIAMVMVLYENERRAVQENLLAFSTLDVDTGKLLEAADLKPAIDKIVARLLGLLKLERAAVCIVGRYHEILPCTQAGLSPEFLTNLQKKGMADALSAFVYRRGGWAVFRNLKEDLLQMPTGPEDHVPGLRAVFQEEGVEALAAVSLQTRDRNFGVVLLPLPSGRRPLGSSQVRLLLGLALQIGMTLENYVLMHKTQRRTREYELLTQIGQVVSSRLDPDEALRAIHRELGRLFDTRTFYVAFLEGDELRFEFEVEEGQVQLKRARKIGNGLSEYIIRTGQPLLIRSNMEEERRRLGVVAMGKPAMCFCGVPILRFNQPVGLMAAMNLEREFVYDKRDLEVLETAAAQLAVAMENGRLFAEEQKRSRYLAFLNKVSTTAISSQDSEQMMEEIVGEIQKNFNFDHIGIGILDYATKDIEIKAEAGATAKALGRRVPLGVGLMGRVARSNEMALVQNTAEHLMGILRESRSALCLPITYGETLLGVLNVESRRENAFAQEDVLILRTLADLLATALHNSFIFQKMQQQSITDGLTGIKTRRFFLEALQSEGKRASRSGRPYSVVMIDLDKFKEVNDSLGHLEGDLLLARVGRLLEQKCRQSNVVARYGGDEFVILMPETGVEQALVLSERLRLWVSTDPMLNERHITGSFGVATFPLHGSTVEDILRVADAGMYVSKKAGGNRVSTAEEFVEGESTAQQRHLIGSYVEGFLRREQTGPDSADELVATLKKMSASVQSGSDEEMLMDAVRTLTRAAETREVSAGHGENVARYAEIIGQEMALAEDELADLVFAARVHDVGKIVIPERILNKPGPLTEDEFQLVKCHPTVGAEIVEVVPGSARVRQYVRHHHERFDGTGYPDGLRGEHIPLGARIIAVAEAYLDMTTERPYAPIKTPQEAIAEMETLSGTQFDGLLVRILIRQLRGERVGRGGGQ